MKKTILLLTTILSCSLLSFGQNNEMTLQEVAAMPGKYIYQDVYRHNPPSFPRCDLSDSLKIGESTLRAEYELLVVSDTMSTTKYQDKVICLIGDELYWTFGESSWALNMRATHQLAGSPDASKYNRSEGCTEIFASSVYRDLKTGSLINCGLIPEIRNTMFRYDEKLPEMNWELTGETEVVAGYECQKAVTEYAGRKWTVLFSPEVPVDCGLWKFNGLPGLIMRAADSKEEYVFTLTSIEHKQEDITRYPEREMVVSRKEYRKAEKNSHDDPILVSKGAEGYLIIMSRSRNLTGKEIFTSGHFIYPYNPIELE